MSTCIIPKGYKPALSLYDTQKAIGLIKHDFAELLAASLKLNRVSAPLFVPAGLGINDDLNGVEEPVSFVMTETGTEAQIVQSLAKWKRLALRDYDFHVGKGLYADMNAIRKDEITDNLHSIYVDQWDWERVITEEDRSLAFLEGIVQKIVSAICATELNLRARFPELDRLPVHSNSVTCITTQELLDLYPDKTPKEREDAFVAEHGTTFIEKIGAPLSDGKPHDGRAPDYDDWELNGDILFWNEPLQCSYEISSMGIRVSPESLAAQLEASGHTERKEFYFHKELLEGRLPYTMGGGIGQSRLCMLLLGSAHIGEVQTSIWDKETKEKCTEAGIAIL